MKYFVILLMLVSLVSFTASNSVYGLSCDGTNMTQSFEESDVVFAGQALSKEYVPSESSTVDGKNDAITQFSVIEEFKGISQDTIPIISSEWLWGYNFTENLEYVVFAYNDGQHFRHQLCTSTSLLENTKLEQIRQVANDLELIVTNSTHAKWNVGEMQWLETSYPPSGVGIVRVIDPDMNLNPEKVDNLDIYVWSDSHTKGFVATATETGVSTGIFESTTFLTIDHESAGQRLKVAEGDAVTAEYEDSTLPASYTVSVLSVIAKSEIRTPLESPLKQIKSGISVHGIQCNDSLVLVTKYDGSPACVKEQTKQKLIERGWNSSEEIKNMLSSQYTVFEDVKKLLVENKINYLQDKLVVTSGISFQGDSGCGAVVDTDSQTHWFGIDSISKPTEITLFSENPNMCKVNTSSCFCNAQMELKSLTIDELIYFTTAEEEKYSEILIDYLYDQNINITPKFQLGKQNLNYADSSAIGYCGHIWGTNTYGFFSGAIVSNIVEDYGIEKELPLLCAISENAKWWEDEN